ncbi:MAG: hypothetical protein ACYDBB_22875 [Armatimonadota bacterium]
MRTFLMAFFLCTLTVAAGAQVGEPWTESLVNWGLQVHQDPKLSLHSTNLRFDKTFKRFGAGSLACDIVNTDVPGYTEVRYTFPQSFDACAYDALHISYHLSNRLKPTGFTVMLSSPDWKSIVGLKEALKPVSGDWQDITIPLSTLGSDKPGWDWANVGNIMVNFYLFDVPRQTGAIHIDGIWLERTGKGIGERKPSQSIIFLDYYEPDKDIDATHRKTLEAKGYVVAWGLLQKQTWATLSKFNVAVLGIHPEADPNKPGEWAQEMAGKRQLLEKFVAEGGGLLVTSTPYTTNSGTGINQLLQPMGLTLVNEQVTDPQGITFQQELFPYMEFAYTDAVTRDPLTEGVRGMWYATTVQFTGGGGGAFTAAMQPGPDWKVLMKGSPTAATHRYKGSFGLEENSGTIPTSPALCAVRQMGKGRVAVLSSNVTHTWLSGYHPWWDGLVMKKGAKGKPSDTEQLLCNLYAYLTEPSRESASIGGYTGEKPEPISGAKYVSAGDEGGILDWEKLAAPGPSPHQYLGLIGAHSAFSDGAGTVVEWVAAAKAAGYQWIAFTEPYRKMTEAKWNQLKAECKLAGDATFCAIPGMEFIDHAGNHSLVLAPIPWPDPKLEAERMELPQAIGYAYNGPTQVQFRMHEGLLPWYRNQFHFAGVFTYRNGKLVDDGEREYHELSARTFQVWPLAIHETYSPAGVAVERNTGYQNYYTYGSLEKMLDDFCYAYGGKYLFFYYHDLAYISSGPKIERFRVVNNGTTYFDIPPEWSDSWRETKGAERWRVTARASSPVGIESMSILDAGKPIRTYLTGGTTQVDQIVDGHHDRQYCFGVELVDNNGGRALAAASNTTAGRHWYTNCTDNVNIMEGGTYGPTDKPPKGYECYFQRWGSWFWADLGIKDRQPLNLPHDERLRFASTDCVIVDHHYEVTHDKDVLGVGGGRMMRPLHPLTDFTGVYRTIHFTSGVDTADFTLIEPKITIKRDVTVTASWFPNFRFLLYSHGKATAKGDFAFTAVTTEDGRTLVEQTLADNTWPKPSHTGTLPVGGYAAAFPNYTGVGAIFALAPDTQFAIEGNANSRRIQIGKQLQPGTVLKTGTVLSTRVLFMEGRWRQPAGNDEIENNRKLLGLTGKPGYTVTPSLGKVADTLYTCTLAPQGYAFRGKFTQAPLPVDLPIIVQGLQENWDAGVWIVGTDRVRHFGIFEKNGYTTLRLNKGPVEAFIGHPIICDHPVLVLSLIETDSKHLHIVAHNPTLQPIKTRVRKNQGFDLGPALDKVITVPAGESVTVE